jgi:iron complex transport system substrate-binding protein
VRSTSRRSFLALTAGAALIAAGCTPKKPGAVASDGSVTVKHAFGETKIPSPPKRVVSAGFNEQDDLLALGVVPIAVTDWFGSEPFGVWPWAQDKLGGAQPTLLSLANGIQIDPIAALKPDLIVATNAGLDKDTYTKLSAIAPTIAQTGQDAFFEPWMAQASAIGQAVFKFDDMKTFVSAVGDKFAAAGQQHASFTGKKVFVVGGTFFNDHAEVTPAGWSTDYLTKMGLVVPGGLDDYVHGERALVPRDRLASVLDTADVLIWTTESDDQQGALLADPTVAQLKATKSKANVFTGKDLTGAIAFASVLSYPFVAEQLPPLLAKVLG